MTTTAAPAPRTIEVFRRSRPASPRIAQPAVIDFWKSREHFDRFAADRIGPGMAAAGIAGGPPEIHEFPVHEHLPR
jgi:hypothetical protein